MFFGPWFLVGIIKTSLGALHQLSKMPKGKKAKGEESTLPSPHLHQYTGGQIDGQSFEKRPKIICIGQDIQPKRDLTCFLR
jgi:large subunit ribosomal protein L7Ae